MSEEFIYYLRDMMPAPIITVEPDGTVYVHSEIMLDNHKNVPCFPENLRVKDFLSVADSDILTLPKVLEVGSYLDLRRTGIETLSEKLIVQGSMYIERTTIARFPKGMIIGEDIWAGNFMEFYPFPSDIQIGGELRGEYSIISNTKQFMEEL